MAQTGYTPILIYSSSTTTNAPAAGNLTNSTLGSELAINITDGKLFYKDNANAIQVIGWKTTPTSAGGTGLTSYTAGDLLYYASGTALSKLGIGTNGQILKSTGSAPAWENVSALAVTSISFGSTGLTPSTATQGAVTVAGTLGVANGGTGLTAVTAGYIPFGNSASALGTSANLFWDNANIRLGLGTSSPRVKLEMAFVGGASSTNWSWVGANSLSPPAACTYGLLTGGNLSQGSSEANFIWGSGVSSSQYLAIGKWDGATYTEQTRMTYSGSWLCGTTQDYGVGALGWYFAKAGFVWANDNTGSASNRNWNAGVNGYAAGAWQLTISSANNNWPNSAYAFAVTSAGSCLNITGTYGTLSDVRFKENIFDARGYADDLMKVRVVKYSLKDEQSEVATKLGVIAQEIEQIFPGMIDVGQTPNGDEMKSVKMSIFLPMLIKAFQELKQEVDALKGTK